MQSELIHSHRPSLIHSVLSGFTLQSRTVLEKGFGGKEKKRKKNARNIKKVLNWTFLHHSSATIYTFNPGRCTFKSKALRSNYSLWIILFLKGIKIHRGWLHGTTSATNPKSTLLDLYFEEESWQNKSLSITNRLIISLRQDTMG